MRTHTPRPDGGGAALVTLLGLLGKPCSSKEPTMTNRKTKQRQVARVYTTRSEERLKEGKVRRESTQREKISIASAGLTIRGLRNSSKAPRTLAASGTSEV